MLLRRFSLPLLALLPALPARAADVSIPDIHREPNALETVGVAEAGGLAKDEGRGAASTSSVGAPAPSEKDAAASAGKGMVRIPAGCFDMGGDGGDLWEAPVHRVCVSAFSMEATEVTQGDYRKVAGSNPSKFGTCGDRCPVEHVDWNDAREYCKRVGKRLPTEAEWEYAARAGTTTKWFWGDQENRAGEYAWFDGNSGNRTHPVGRKKPNAWGLYDMAGNVTEWTSDGFGGYDPGEQKDPSVSSFGSSLAIRGGSWSNGPDYLRSSHRGGETPEGRGGGLGFRCVVSGP